MPVHVFCCYSISGFPHIKSAPKIWENQIKNQREGTFRKHLGGARGTPLGAQAPWWRGQGVERAAYPPGCLVAPLGAPLGLYLAPAEETPNVEVFFPISSLNHRRRFKIGAAR